MTGSRRGGPGTAYAMGVLDPRGTRIALARNHLAECPACRARVRTLRAGTSGGAHPGPNAAGPRGVPAKRARLPTP